MRLGIVGCGLIGQKRATAAVATGHAVVVVADKDAARASALAGRYGAEAKADWRDVVAADLDAVIVATSHDSLAMIARGAVEAGKHVLVEKPAGLNLEEVSALAAAARVAARIVKVGFNHRFHPAILKARAIVDSGALGPLLYIRARYGHGGRPGYENEWRCQRELSGGGELIDQGSHLIDLSRWFLGDLSLDYAHTPTFYWPIKVDDSCFLALRSQNGQIAWLHATWVEWKNMFSFEIVGRTGKLAIDGLGGSYGVERLVHYRMLPQIGPPESESWEWAAADDSWGKELADFVSAIAGNRQPCGTIDDAIAMHELIEHAYRRRTP